MVVLQYLASCVLIFSVFTSVFTPEEAAYPNSPKPNVASAFVPPPCLSVVIGV